MSYLQALVPCASVQSLIGRVKRSGHHHCPATSSSNQAMLCITSQFPQIVTDDLTRYREL